MPKAIDKDNDKENIVKKSVEKESKTIEKTYSQKELESILASFKEDIKKEIMTDKDIKEDEKPRKRISKLASLDMTTRVVIRTNASGSLSWSTSKGRTGVNVSFNDYGDEDLVTIEDLREIDRHSKLVSGGYIAIVDIYSDEIDVEDVIDVIKKGKLYYGDGISPSGIEDVLTSDINYHDFKQKFLNSKNMEYIILSVAKRLIKEGRLNNASVIDCLKSLTRGMPFNISK